VNSARVSELLDRLLAGDVSREEVLEELARLPFSDLGDARVDVHRSLRQGTPEVIFGQGKTPDQIARIAREIRASGENAIATRVDPALAAAVRIELPEFEYLESARLLVLRARAIEIRGRGSIAVVSAGTSDLPVAEEAAVVAELLGNKVERLYDAGVAGLHRLLASLDVLRSAHVLIVVAGMEGALPSVVGGLVARPVIAVPTSVGYGASLGGVAALLGMLNSCASNVTVVNIDNGFGAASVASLVNQETAP